ncbi:hypothetical protein BS78_03G162600 [Paspalum vaginatum]|nr:hypothetical protein BS78_03G162600 [Paspalum vaginatum]
MAQPGWSSLPADLVTHVTGCLLATNDLDYYADLRVVCHHWRFATADPRSNQQQGPRFRPTRWVMLDEHEFSSPSSDGATTATACVFSNATTGRFVRKSLSPPLLRGDYTFITTTTGGLIVLAARASLHGRVRPQPPHRLLDPLRGATAEHRGSGSGSVHRPPCRFFPHSRLGLRLN